MQQYPCSARPGAAEAAVPRALGPRVPADPERARRNGEQVLARLLGDAPELVIEADREDLARRVERRRAACRARSPR